MDTVKKKRRVINKSKNQRKPKYEPTGNFPAWFGILTRAEPISIGVIK